ncbi:MAG: Holliday junction resolvase RuvX [Propionibacteriaceae bacterium]|jgi:putative Holliday junction resolvase|nr:Holliday junction resolvase RuvX [Propionibacteriaceae bacterium]
MGAEFGVRLALDWGTARIGVAACDSAGVLAYPVESVPNTTGALSRIAQLVTQYAPAEIVMGMPFNLAGREAQAATAVREHAQEVADALQLPVRLVDERLTTAQATKELRAAGRSTRHTRDVIDQVAAVALLRYVLDCVSDPNYEVVVPR